MGEFKDFFLSKSKQLSEQEAAAKRARMQADQQASEAELDRHRKQQQEKIQASLLREEIDNALDIQQAIYELCDYLNTKGEQEKKHWWSMPTWKVTSVADVAMTKGYNNDYATYRYIFYKGYLLYGGGFLFVGRSVEIESFGESQIWGDGVEMLKRYRLNFRRDNQEAELPVEEVFIAYRETLGNLADWIQQEHRFSTLIQIDSSNTLKYHLDNAAKVQEAKNEFGQKLATCASKLHGFPRGR